MAVIKDFEMGRFSWVTWVGQSNNKSRKKREDGGIKVHCRRWENRSNGLE